MTAPPEKKESNTITLVVEKWMKGQTEQISPVHRINGFPLRLRMFRLCKGDQLSDKAEVDLICDKSDEAELWKLTATLTKFFSSARKYGNKTAPRKLVFCSWRQCWQDIGVAPCKAGSTVQVTIAIAEGGESFCGSVRPNPNSINPPNGILVVGDEKKKIRVNKEFLASQSPYFDRLFFGDFMEKNMAEIPIGDVEYSEFNNIINMVYGWERVYGSCWSWSSEKVHIVLDLADRFELKIVEDKVVSILFSDKSPNMTVAQKLLMSQERNLPTLKNLCFSHCSYAFEMKSMKKEPEYADFSDALKAEILDRVLDLI